MKWTAAQAVSPWKVRRFAADTRLRKKLWRGRQPPLQFVCEALVAGCRYRSRSCFRRRGAAIYVDWTWKRKLSPRGGRPFLTRVELPVPSFQQGDDKWRDDPLGGVAENGTIGGEGCAVAAAAMVFKFYGINVDPQQLNWFLTATGGYTEQGWLYWDRAAWFAPDRVRHVYEDLPSYQLIDSNIAHGNPVIVRVRLRSGITHFVVIAGKDGFDYLVRDPGAGSAKGLYPLRELGSDIEALRFYEPIANPKSQLAARQ